VEPVSLADLFPTICGLSNLAPPEGLDGIDLSSVLRGDKGDNPLDQRLGVITESLTPRWGKGTEFRMIRSERYKYVAFRGCNDLAFDLQEEPGEQRNLLATGEISPELTTLKSAVLDDFNFDDVAQACLRGTEQLRQKYPRRVTPKTPNQICLKDGRLVEADAPLYQPSVVSQNLSLDFDDPPANS
jgi:choline-sulfatase